MTAELQDKIVAPRRRPSAGGYARGEETRARIVAAAIKVFGREGYEAASTRRIAEVAGVRPPALQYYFDSKEGLHRACAEEILANCEPVFTALEALARERFDDPPSALAGFLRLIDALAEMTLRPRKPGYSEFAAHAQGEGGGPGADLLMQRLKEPLRDRAIALAAQVRGVDAGDETLRLDVTLILSQLTLFHVRREGSLAFLGWAAIGPEECARIKARARRLAERVLRPD